MRVPVDCKCCNLIGEPDFKLTKVLGPRKASMYTRPSFGRGSGKKTRFWVCLVVNFTFGLGVLWWRGRLAQGDYFECGDYRDGPGGLAICVCLRKFQFH